MCLPGHTNVLEILDHIKKFNVLKNGLIFFLLFFFFFLYDMFSVRFDIDAILRTQQDIQCLLYAGMFM